MSGRFPRIRFLPSIALLLFEFAFAQQAGLSGQAGTAQNISAQQTPDQSRYLDELQVKREENWFQREIRRFRTYPHLVRAYQLIDQGRLVEARQELENYLKIDPQDLQVRLNYVTLLYRMKDFAAAVGQSSLILETKPVFVPALLYRGMGRQELGQRQEAMADFKTAAGSANIQPSDRIFALNMIADLAIRQKSHSQALTALTTLNKSKEEFANYFRIGIVFDQLNRLGESEAAFQKAFRLAAQPSERVQALRAIGVLAEKRQDLNSAKKALQASLAIKPSDPNLIRFLAQTTYELAFRQKLYSEALAALSHVGDSTDFGTLLRRGLALEKQNRVSEAESAYLSAIKLAGTEAEQARIYRSLGDLAKHRGDLQQAEKSFLEAWRLDPQNRDAIRALADIAYRQKDYGQAVKWSRQLSALSSSPADREILAN
ncbi:MAG TPA: tetratricopeptide repeat protein, partial [Acidobacteriota bacterium]|nr:tetratricopeptide repeat protein [Acidobacteriota bacterium]